jgi:protein phosphatase PTC7
LDISNLGDSQLVVLRDGKLILEVEPGTWAFNSPFQIGFGLYGEPQGEVDEMTIKKELKLRKGDVIVMGTDGLFDNVYVKEIETIIQNRRVELSASANENEISDWLSSVVRNLTQKAYTLGLDDNYLSPFSKEAIEAGKAPSNYSGG